MAEPSPVRRFFGAALMAVGVLIMLLSGLCSAGTIVVMVTSLLGSPPQNSQLLQYIGGSLVMVLNWGGIPFAVGFGLFFAGKQLRKEGSPDG